MILLCNAVLLAASFHILVLALGIYTTQIDHAIMIYRDLWSMGRFPTTIYSGVIGILLQWVVPVALMVTIPVRSLSEPISILSLALYLCWGIGCFLLSVQIWKWSLRHYTSASS